MRQRTFQRKKVSSPVPLVSISTLKPLTRGFGSESLQPSATTSLQLLRKPNTHDISNISPRPQAKLSISQPGDVYEQEADSVAKQVMQRMAQSGNRQSIQRQEVSEEEEIQTKSLDISTLQRQEVSEEEEIQTKSLDIRTLQRQEMPEEEEIQTKSLDISTLQRQEVSEEEEIQTKSLLQPKSEKGIATEKNLETSLHQAKGGGQPLGDNIKKPMEQAFGADFGKVKIHTNGKSDQLNRSIQARAFTTGQDIFFRQGEYNPSSSTGQELLAHELTHVVQQNGGMVQKKTSEPTTTNEQGVKKNDTGEIDNNAAAQKQKFLDNYAVAKELIQGIDEGLATDKILTQLLKNFQKISFKYTMKYKQGIALLKGTREGDSQTLSEAFQIVAQEYYGIENIKIEEIKKPALSEEKDTVFQGMKRNCDRGKYWFLENHYWPTWEGKVYDTLFQSDKRPQVDMSGSEDTLDSMIMPEGKYYKTDKGKVVYPFANEYFSIELRMFEQLRNFINDSSKFVGQDMMGIVEQIKEILMKGGDSSDLESLMREVENRRTSVVTGNYATE